LFFKTARDDLSEDQKTNRYILSFRTQLTFI